MAPTSGRGDAYASSHLRGLLGGALCPLSGSIDAQSDPEVCLLDTGQTLGMTLSPATASRPHVLNTS